MRRILQAAAFAVALLPGAVLAGPNEPLPSPAVSNVPAAGSARTITIGLLTDLTGKGAYLGRQVQAAAKLVEEELNERGKRVAIVVGEHGLDTAKAVTEVQKLLNVDQVEAVYSMFSGPTRAANPIVKNANRLFVYAAAAVEPVNTNPYAFKSYLDYVLGCEAVAATWKKQGVTTVGVLKAEAEFGELCLEGVKHLYPEPVLAAYKPGDDLSSQVLTLKSKGVEAIMNAGYEGDMESLLKAMERIQWTARIGANEDIYTERLIGAYPAGLAQAVSFGMPKLPAAFVAKVRAIDPKNLTGALDQAGLAYLHLKQMVDALTACPRSDTACISKQLLQSKPIPDFGFTGWRESRQANFSWTVRFFRNGRFQE